MANSVEDDPVVAAWAVIMAQQQVLFALLQSLVDSNALAPREAARMLRDAAATLPPIQQERVSPAGLFRRVIEAAARRMERSVVWPVIEPRRLERSRFWPR